MVNVRALAEGSAPGASDGYPRATVGPKPGSSRFYRGFVTAPYLPRERCADSHFRYVGESLFWFDYLQSFYREKCRLLKVATWLPRSRAVAATIKS